MVIIPDAAIGKPGAKSIPLLGLGTAANLPANPEKVKTAVIHAIKLGYRHFDTAAAYQSEQPLGEAIADCIKLGFIKSRDELFITSKLSISDAHPHRVLPAIRQTLKDLGMEYLDLYLIHWPISGKPGKSGFSIDHIEDLDLKPMDFTSVWESMEECHSLGLAKSIGVSNFSCKKLQIILERARIPPAVNQVEMNPFWHQKSLREFCKANGIHISAYSPLGSKGAIWGSSRVMDSQVLQEIANAKGKTLAQVSLRWVYEQGASVIVKSFDENRIQENLDIFDWQLSHEDKLNIEQIPQKKSVLFHQIVSENGPYKSLEDLWDEKVE